MGGGESWRRRMTRWRRRRWRRRCRRRCGWRKGRRRERMKNLGGEKGVNKVNMMVEGKCLGYLAKEA